MHMGVALPALAWKVSKVGELKVLVPRQKSCRFCAISGTNLRNLPRKENLLFEPSVARVAGVVFPFSPEP